MKEQTRSTRVVCNACGGFGSVSTGIGEAPTTMCNACEGLGNIQAVEVNRAECVPDDASHLRQRVAYLTAELHNTVPKGFDVRTIMLDVVPGDGDGHEVYAKSVAQVEEKLGELGLQNEDLQGELVTLRVQLAEAKTMERFVGYLLDNCEGQIIYEESLQQWVAQMLAKEKSQ